MRKKYKGRVRVTKNGGKKGRGVEKQGGGGGGGGGCGEDVTNDARFREGATKGGGIYVRMGGQLC